MLEPVRYAGALLRRDMLLALTTPFAVATQIFSAIVSVAGFYFVARLIDPHRTLDVEGRHIGYFTYVSVNLTFMLLQTSALQAFAQSIRVDQLLGTLEPILATKVAPALYVVASGLWPLVLSLVQIVVTFTVASAAFGLSFASTDPLALATFAVLSTAAMAGLGLLGAAAVIAFKQMPPSAYLVGGAGSLLAGTLFPVRLLPRPLQALSWCLPLTHSLAGLRGAIVGVPLARLAPDAWWLAIASLLLVPAAFVALDAVIERGRRDGTLAQY